MATANTAALGRQQKCFRRLALVAMVVATLGLAGCGGGNTGLEGLSEAPNVGFTDPPQGLTTLQFTPPELRALLSGGNTPGAGG